MIRKEKHSDKVYTVRIRIDLEYKVEAKDADHAQDIVANMDLPMEYVTDSVELVRVTPED